MSIDIEQDHVSQILKCVYNILNNQGFRLVPSREAVLRELGEKEANNSAPIPGSDGELNTSSTQSTFVDDGVSIWLSQ